MQRSTDPANRARGPAGLRRAIDGLKKFYSFSTPFPVVDRSLLETAELKLVGRGIVYATEHTAFSVLADERTWPQWYPTIRSVEWLSAPRTEGGTRLVKRRGRPSYVQQVIEWEPPFRMTFCLIKGREPGTKAAVEELVLRPLSPGVCELTWRLGVEPAGVGSALSPLLGAMNRYHPALRNRRNVVPSRFAQYVARVHPG